VGIHDTAKWNLSNTELGVDDYSPAVSAGGKKVAYLSYGIQTSNPEGDYEIYRMNTTDGTGKKNLSNNGSGVSEDSPDWGVQAN